MHGYMHKGNAILRKLEDENPNAVSSLLRHKKLFEQCAATRKKREKKEVNKDWSLFRKFFSFNEEN